MTDDEIAESHEPEYSEFWGMECSCGATTGRYYTAHILAVRREAALLREGTVGPG